MAKNLYFTEEQLRKLKRKDLFKVAQYYGLEVHYRGSKKEDILNAILEYFGMVEVPDDTPKSVRVRRIQESMK